MPSLTPNKHPIMRKSNPHTKSNIATFLFVIFNSITLPLLSSHTTIGGEMWSSHIGNNKYEITFKAYKHCSSTTKAPDSITVYAYAGAKAACGSTDLIAKRTASRYISTKCSTAKDCDKGIPLYEHTFKCTADLNSTAFKSILNGSSCQVLTFYTNHFLQSALGSCGSTAQAIFSTTLYLNNLAGCNNTYNIAPAQIIDPLRVFTINRATQFDHGLSDTFDRDMMRFQLTASQAGNQPYSATACANTPTKDYKNPLTPFCLGTATCSPNAKTNPPRGTFFDSFTGLMVFTPTIAKEMGVIATQIFEYRINKKGAYTLIASHTREIATITIDASTANAPPSINANVFEIKICVGNTVKQKIADLTDVVTSSQTIADSLIVTTAPNFRGASIKEYVTSKNRRALEFNWTPSMADTLAHGYIFPIKVNDQNCNTPLELTTTLLVRVFPPTSGLPQVTYKGCNQLILSMINFKGGSNPRCSWQVLDSGNKSVATSTLPQDSVRINGSGKYTILALLSNEGGCFKYWDTTINIRDTFINFTLGNAKPIADTINCPGNQPLLEPQNIIARKGNLTYQWYGLDAASVLLNQNPQKINPNTLPKIGSSKSIVLNTQKDTSVILIITDAKGCTEAQQLNIVQIFSTPIKWKQKPLMPICASDPPFKLIAPTTKDMIDGGKHTFIKCLNGNLLDSIGPDYYKIKSPAKIARQEKITLTLLASYDTLGCVSTDTNRIDVIYRPLFELASKIDICSRDSAYFLGDAITKPAQKASPYDWKIIGMPSKSIAQVATLTLGGRKGLHLITHFDSIAIGTYSLLACAQDSALGCRSCDTVSIVSNAENTIKFTGDTLLCPNTKPLRLRNYLQVSSGELNDSLYAIQLKSLNNNPNFTAQIATQFLNTNSILNPRIATGRAVIALTANKACYANDSISLRIQDTLPISFSVSPDSVIRLPKTAFTFTANSSSPKIWWYFGTGNSADTSLLNPITWAYESAVGSYLVTARSFNSNGCYGETQQRVSVMNVSNAMLFSRDAQINQQLQLVSNTWLIDYLEVYDSQGKLVYRANTNAGVPKNRLAKGVYSYKIRAKMNQTPYEKRGKWLNLED